MQKGLVWKIVLLTSLVVMAGEFVVKSGSKDVGNKIEQTKQDSKAGPIESIGCNQFSSVEYMSYPKYSSFSKPNNKFGLYIYAEEDRFFKLAENLVNSNGGDWGYVLIPYNIKDRDAQKWTNVFESLSKRHLIPIIQLWDVDPNKYKGDTQEAAKFLNGFMWPVKERYVSVYNEPNDDKFWKGKADPKNYAKVLNYTVDAFKKEGANFFMLNGALNASAPDGGGYINPISFMYFMDQEIPGIFSELDGWASHSYPQPNFAGSPHASGLWSIRAYEDELAYIKSLGVDKDLPVFITETGWAHAQGEVYRDIYYDAETAAQNYKIAFEEVWLKDDRVRAVTPFTVYYKPPFDHFSWINDDNVPYVQYEIVKKIEKVKGEPAVLQKSQMQISDCPDQP